MIPHNNTVVPKCEPCSKHPKYEAKRHPLVSCTQCWTLYFGTLRSGQAVAPRVFRIANSTSFDGAHSIAEKLGLTERQPRRVQSEAFPRYHSRGQGYGLTCATPDEECDCDEGVSSEAAEKAWMSGTATEQHLINSVSKLDRWAGVKIIAKRFHLLGYKLAKARRKAGL